MAAYFDSHLHAKTKHQFSRKENLALAFLCNKNTYLLLIKEFKIFFRWKNDGFKNFNLIIKFIFSIIY